MVTRPSRTGHAIKARFGVGVELKYKTDSYTSVRVEDKGGRGGGGREGGAFQST